MHVPSHRQPSLAWCTALSVALLSACATPAPPARQDVPLPSHHQGPPPTVGPQHGPADPRALGSTAVGVLVLPGQEPWGLFYEPGFDWAWAGTEREITWRFLVGGTEHAPYFAAVDPVRTPFDLTVQVPQGRTQYVVDTAPGASVAAARAQGVAGSIQLVELEVNDGRGGSGTHFVATHTRVLDADLGRRLAAAGAAFDARVRAHTGALAQRLGEAEAATRARVSQALRGPAPLDLQQVAYRPTWNPLTSRVEVTFGYRHVRGVIIRTMPETPFTKGPSAPRELTVRYAAGMGARYALEPDGPRELELIAPTVFEDGSGNARLPWTSQVNPAPPPAPRPAPGPPPPAPAPTPAPEGDLGELPDCPDPQCTGPRMGMPNWQCIGGVRGGPACKRVRPGECGWVVVRCAKLVR